MAAAAPVAVRMPLAPEDAARADFYALLARLLGNGPDGALLAQLAAARPLPAGTPLAPAWQALVDASSVMDADAGLLEYERLFAGLGKAPVSIYAGSYSGAHAVGHPRVRIQADLAAAGLEHRVTTEPEDHFATLFDAMRILVGGTAQRPPAALERQRAFFDSHVRASAPRLFAALGKAHEANYYRKVAALGAAFIAVEGEAFQLE
ncbi:MAG TPA: molecular chaperone TorD family protein [Usitatibacter sp.]|nr:molecular chaperone TorD family protein [Usitatibacter sp.]